jgi:hypothetical protein
MSPAVRGYKTRSQSGHLAFEWTRFLPPFHSPFFTAVDAKDLVGLRPADIRDSELRMKNFAAHPQTELLSSAVLLSDCL